MWLVWVSCGGLFFFWGLLVGVWLRVKLLTCLCVYRLELLPQLREQPGREGEVERCAREGGMIERRGDGGAVR